MQLARGGCVIPHPATRDRISSHIPLHGVVSHTRAIVQTLHTKRPSLLTGRSLVCGSPCLPAMQCEDDSRAEHNMRRCTRLHHARETAHQARHVHSRCRIGLAYIVLRAWSRFICTMSEPGEDATDGDAASRPPGDVQGLGMLYNT